MAVHARFIFFQYIHGRKGKKGICLKITNKNLRWLFIMFRVFFIYAERFYLRNICHVPFVRNIRGKTKMRINRRKVNPLKQRNCAVFFSFTFFVTREFLSGGTKKTILFRRATPGTSQNKRNYKKRKHDDALTHQ